MVSADALQEKVTAFVLRSASSGPELLIFRHPTAGFQLPAGTVEMGEDPADTVVREVAEETGLAVEIVKFCGVEEILFEDSWAVLRPESTTLRTSPHPQAAVLPDRLQRNGFITGECCGGFVWVRREEYDLHQDPPFLLWTQEGWIPEDEIALGLRRHFFVLRATADSPVEWDWPADQGHIFHLFWVPAAQPPWLIGYQNDWLKWLPANLIQAELSPDN